MTNDLHHYAITQGECRSDATTSACSLRVDDWRIGTERSFYSEMRENFSGERLQLLKGNRIFLGEVERGDLNLDDAAAFLHDQVGSEVGGMRDPDRPVA